MADHDDDLTMRTGDILHQEYEINCDTGEQRLVRQSVTRRENVAVELPPGRALNVLVARDVMGQTDFSHGEPRHSEGWREDGSDGWDHYGCPRCFASEGSTEPCARPYSTDLEAAWSIITDPRHEGWYWSIRQGVGGEKAWAVQITSIEAGRVQADADTVEHAICLAALKTVEVRKHGGVA